MKNFSKLIVLIALFAAILGCNNKAQTVDEIIYLNIDGIYPEKTIYLEDVANIKYVQMDFDSEYLFGRSCLIYVATTKIVIYDFITHDVMFFSIDGKPLSKFNRHGNGPGEFPTSFGLFYIDEEDRLYVNVANTFKVYSSNGDYFYDIKIPLDDTGLSTVVNFDKESLLVYRYSDAINKNFARFSKKDASLIEEIDIIADKDIFFPANVFRFNFVRYKDGYLLSEHSNDTVFYYGQDKKLVPKLIRTPPIATLDPYYYSYGFIEAGDYIFLNRIIVENERRRPFDCLMINKNDQSIYKQKVLMKDFEVMVMNLDGQIFSGNHDSKVGFYRLSVDLLSRALEENLLSGELKERAMAFDEYSNDVFMLMLFK